MSFAFSGSVCEANSFFDASMSTSARDFERSFLPFGAAFLREGQIWQACRDCELGFLAWFSRPASALNLSAAIPVEQPFFPFGAARFPRGERVRILTLDDPRPLSVSFVPVRYAELQDILLPENIRTRLDYTHYNLTATTARTFGFEKTADYFLDCFEQVELAGGGA